MVQERLQGSFSQMDMRTLIKFHVLLGKTALECYKSLKEGSGTHTAPCENVCLYVNGIKNGWKETDNTPCNGAPTSATDERHMEQVKSVPECMRSISCMAIATKVRISPFTVSSPTGWWNKKFVKIGNHTC
jgi:hypothetical protein